MAEVVLVTGASGFIGCHTVKQLLEKGYKVRGTVRNLENLQECQPLRDLCPHAKHALELVEADCLDADSWKRAVIGCKYVIHHASPCPIKQPRNEDEVIRPAIEGTLSVLRACAASKSVKRVVLTSSIAAIAAGNTDQLLTENLWADVKCKHVTPYEKSKTLAEKSAWDYVNSLPDGEKFELVSVLPAHVQGPMLHKTECLSMEIIKHLLEEKLPMIPRAGLPMVDVRDVALAHIKAMELPELAGSRNIVFAQFLWFKDVAEMLKTEFEPRGFHVVTRMAPYLLAWVNGLYDPVVRQILQLWGIEFRMTKMMGIDPPRDIKTSILEMAHSMLDKDLINIPKRIKNRAKQSQT